MTALRPFLSIAFFLALLSGTATGQYGGLVDSLKIVRIDTDNFPTIRVHVRAFCGGQQYKGLSSIQMTVKDDGIGKTFTMSCPSVTVPMSVALALDRSGSVAGTSIYRIQQGAWEFVELFQQHTSGQDEGAIITFADFATLDRPLTTNIVDLKKTIQQIFPFGSTALWDGVLLALDHLHNNASNPIRAVVVLSDGGDNASISDINDVIAYARLTGIPVYSLCISYHSKPQEVAAMRAVADSTGGLFFDITHPDDIVTVFNAIASRITGGANDCIIEYKVDCADGSWHEVTVTAQACGKTLTQSAWYQKPIDPGLPIVTLSFDSTQAYENGDLFIPVIISATGAQAEITNLEFKIFRQDSIFFEDLIYQKYFGRHFTVQYGQNGDTLNVAMNGDATLTGSDTLCVLRYRLGSFPKDTTLPLLLYYVDKKTRQCMLMRITLPGFRVLKRPFVGVACTDSLHVRWDRSNANYEPPLLDIGMNVTNPSPVNAYNTRAWIQAPYGVEVVGPDTVYLAQNILPPNGGEYVQFRLRPLPVDTARVYTICISVKPDSGAVRTCCTTVRVDRGLPSLQISCSMPREIRWSDSANGYIPPVFPVTVSVMNASPVIARNTETWIHIPAGFAINPMTPINTKISPATLKMTETGTATWTLTPLDRPSSDTVEFCIKVAAGLDTAVCCQKMYITKSPVRAQLVCSTPRTVTWDEDKGEYTPKQFFVSTTVRNYSGIDMAQAQGRIILPAFFSLPNGETALKNLPGGAVVPPGDSVTVSWTVICDKPPTGLADVCIEITATNFNTARCCIPVEIIRTGAAPLLSCALTSVDTVRFTDVGYAPNPLVLSLTVRNSGNSAAKQVYAALLQGADLSIDPSDQALKLITDSLATGDSARATFKVLILDRKTARLDTIRVSVYAANGGAYVCEKVVFIEAVRGPLLELSCSAPDSLVFSDSLNGYLPSPFSVSVTATNVGTAFADSVIAELLPAPNIEFVNGEQAAKLLQPFMLDIGQSGVASWQVNAVRRAVGRIDTMRVQVRSKGRVSTTSAPCLMPVFIPAARSVQLEVSCGIVTPPVVVGDRYSPDPFPVRLVVRNTGEARGFAVTASLLSQGRLQLAPGDSITKTRPSIDARNGTLEFVWNFTALPRSSGDSVEVCFRISALHVGEQTCCTKIWLPPLVTDNITVGCSTVDTVRYDTTARTYPNPVLVSATVTNPGVVVIDSVRATIILPTAVRLSAGETPDRVFRNLNPQETRSADWRIDILDDTSTVIKERRIRIQFYSKGDILTCDRTIIVLPPPRPTGTDTTAFAVFCRSVDSVRYVNAQIGLQPSPFTVSVEVTNTGTTTLTGVQASIQLPNGVSFAAGETPTKSLAAPLQPGQRGSLSWSCIPGLSDVTRTVEFLVRVDVPGAAAQDCRSTTVIQRIERAIMLAIPKGNVAQVGQTISVPVLFTNTTQAVVNDLAFDVGFDASTVNITGIEKENTLTATWSNLQLTQPAAGSVHIAGGSSNPVQGSGILLRLLIQVVSGNGSADAFGIKRSDLILSDARATEGVRVETENGDIVTSGDCVVPLKGSDNVSLLQNRPNPFNPVTRIVYVIPPGAEGASVSLDVFDAFGRHIRRIDEGPRSAGTHTITFDASGLPSGLYHYRLHCAGTVLQRAMVLTK